MPGKAIPGAIGGIWLGNPGKAGKLPGIGPEANDGKLVVGTESGVDVIVADEVESEMK